MIEALEESRLVTLTGPGGVGKTTLALKVAEELTSTFEDGVWFVEVSRSRTTTSWQQRSPGSFTSRRARFSRSPTR